MYWFVKKEYISELKELKVNEKKDLLVKMTEMVLENKAFSANQLGINDKFKPDTKKIIALKAALENGNLIQVKCNMQNMFKKDIESSNENKYLKKA